jgi:hypothetical protein
MAQTQCITNAAALSHGYATRWKYVASIVHKGNDTIGAHVRTPQTDGQHRATSDAMALTPAVIVASAVKLLIVSTEAFPYASGLFHCKLVEAFIASPFAEILHIARCCLLARRKIPRRMQSLAFATLNLIVASFAEDVSYFLFPFTWRESCFRQLSLAVTARTLGITCSVGV